MQGDVDGFIAQHDPKTRKVPEIAAEIAQRLLAAGRAGTRLASSSGPKWAMRAGSRRSGKTRALRCWRRWTGAGVSLGVLRAGLSGEHFRVYLKRLPDFEDIEAEERAMAHAAAHPDLLAAPAFFLNWPSLGRAARLLIDRRDEVDGDHYEFLTPAAETLAEKHPLAATEALRAMIDFTLTEARQKS